MHYENASVQNGFSLLLNQKAYDPSHHENEIFHCAVAVDDHYDLLVLLFWFNQKVNQACE